MGSMLLRFQIAAERWKRAALGRVIEGEAEKLINAGSERPLNRPGRPLVDDGNALILAPWLVETKEGFSQ